MVMSLDTYGHYLRGLITGAVAEAIRSRMYVLVETNVDFSAITLDVNVLGERFPFVFTMQEIEEARAEEKAFRLVGLLHARFEHGFEDGKEYVKPVTHPVADAIAAMRTGAPHIGGDRH